jgi:hypothetical protein
VRGGGASGGLLFECGGLALLGRERAVEAVLASLIAILGTLCRNDPFMDRMDDKLEHGIRRQRVDLVELSADQVCASVSHATSVACRGNPTRACVVVAITVGSLDSQVEAISRHFKSDIFWRQKLGLDSTLRCALCSSWKEI